MPLLKRKAFEKSTVSEYLRDDDEVFHCEVTDEIFKDYEEYCERIILVNSMVWSCEMTGKNNLTYAEALESEKAARRSLKDFPMELRIPILYLAAKTNRSSFAEMSEDVFNFVRDRYFVGEAVEACLEGDQWKEAQVLSVTSQKQQPGSKTVLPPTSYLYEVEQFVEDNPSGGQLGTAPHDRLRRRKGVYSRDKNRLFLKQFVEQGVGGIICIKKVALDKYNINKVVYDQLFTGNPPDFPSSKKLLKLSLSPHKSPSVNTSKLNKSLKKSPEKKGRQESMDKFVKKSDKTESPKPKPNPEAKKSAQELAERMRKAEEQMKQRKEDEKARKKETAAKLQAYLKEWQKVKDDLELEDHKIIPKGTPVEIEGIPQKHVGDFLSVLEFAYVYADILKVKDMFHNELDLETFRRALTTKENAGIFSDIIQMFLTTIFTLQEDEAEEYNEDGGILESTEDTQIKSGIGVTKAVELATKASKWSQTYLGTPLSKLPLDPTTVSEVLRLHVLSSGGAPGGRCATWRYHQRGGYSSPDDAGLHLRAHHPHLLRRLATTHVADLPTDEKFLVLQCLMNQILSYATVRDMIEEKAEEHKNTKQTLRLLQTNERKRDAQVAAARQELKKDCAAKKEGLKVNGVDQLKAKALEEELQTALEKLSKESEEKKHDYEKKLKELQIQLFDYVSYLGSDRAFRRYWVMQKVAGVFVEAGAEPRGACHKATPASPDPAAQTDPLVYVAKVLDSQRERGGSDKENESGANSRGGSPKKPLAHVNGVGRGQLSGRQELLVCTGDLDSCPAHGMIDRPQWWVYHTEDQIEGLIQSLNKRGFREHDLRQTLEMDKPNIVEYIKKCPVHLLNPVVAPPPPAPATRHRKFPQPSLNVPPECSLAEALELALRDHILELEEKIFHGCLGGLKIKDREAWRGTIMLRGYDKQADYLSWGPHRQYRDDYHQPNGVLKVPNGIEEADVKCIPENKYRDPGHYLEAARVNGARAVVAGGEATRSLASALLQVAQGIHHKYIKRPLGLDDKERKDREAKNKPLELETLERWEVSLMECRSVAQVVLHLFTLDSSVTWSASILNASCRLCRRKTDPDNMLLCDGCNKGHHLYCLKPKLSKVPEGDWFCDQCKPKERTPRKKRKLFSDEDIRDALEDSAGSDVDAGVCGACASGGRLRAACVACAARYHAECAAPPPSRAAKRWTCAACLAPTREHSQRRCAVAAITNIHQYARALDARRTSSESYDSDDNVTLGRLKRKRTSKEPSPLVNGAGSARKGRKSKDQTKTSLTNGVHDDRRSRKRRRSVEPVLHEDALAALTADVLRHKDSWPFYEPVSTDEVPDYLDVIKQPMDFSTIKEKLFSGEYSTDYEFMSDAALVFTNCYTYNQDVHPVARAGVRLEKYFNKRCEELNLQTLPTTNLELDTEEAHNGSSSSYDEDQPKVKKLKLK